MSVIKYRVMRIAACAAAGIVVLGLAAYLRIGTLWAPHTDPVELAHLKLAMKMGAHPGLIGYGIAGVEIRNTQAASAGAAGGTLSIATPIVSDPAPAGSFETWPRQDSNPFYYKPPYFAALLAYTHHRLLGPRFAFYPVNAAETVVGQKPQASRAIFQLQGWAVGVPFLFGLIVVFLTWVIGWKMFGFGRGILAAFIAAIYPAHILTATRIWPEAVLTVWVLAAFFLFLHFVAARNAPGCILAGVAWGLAALTDTAALFFLPAFVIWSFRTHKKIINGYLAAFLLGAILLYKVWPDHLHQVFNSSVLRAADMSSASASGVLARVFPVSIEVLILWAIPAAAVIATGCHMANQKAGGLGGPVSEHLISLWTMIVSFVGLRLLFSIHAPWDARALAPILPFIILLAVQKQRAA